jgi:hypothetical protein
VGAAVGGAVGAAVGAGVGRGVGRGAGVRGARVGRGVLCASVRKKKKEQKNRFFRFENFSFRFLPFALERYQCD